MNSDFDDNYGQILGEVGNQVGQRGQNDHYRNPMQNKSN